MIKTIFVMFYDLFTFLVVFLCIFFIFEVTGQLLFSELQIYSTFVDSCATLFGSALGGFGYTDYDALTDVDREIGYLFLTVYLIVSAIMLLNFLIAIFSETYNNLTNRKRGLYMEEVINLRKKYEFHPNYSSIVYSLVPFNWFLLPVIPFIASCKSFKVNNFILHIEYLPVAMFGIITYVIFEVLVIFPTYLLTCWMKFKFIFESPVFSGTDRCARLLDYLIFQLFGMLILVVYIFVDTYKFILSLYSSNIMTTHRNDSDSYNMENQFLGTRSKNFKSSTERKVISTSIRKDFSRISNNRDKINPVKEGLSETTLKFMKVVLGVILRQTFDYIKKNKLSNPKEVYIPTSKVVKLLNYSLCIPEQINSILLGPTYIKSEAYFKSSYHEALLDELQTYDYFNERNSLSDSLKNGQSMRFAPRAGGNKVSSFSRSRSAKNLMNSRTKWDQNIRDFLLSSDEGWLLHQYNLCKTFFIHNSVVKGTEYALNFPLDIEIETGSNLNSHRKSTYMSERSQDQVKMLDVQSLYKIIKEIEKRIQSKTEFSQLVSEAELFKYNFDLL